MIKFTTHNQEEINIEGTGLTGCCEEGTTYSDIVRSFGEPQTDLPEWKVKAQWIIHFSDTNAIATIYCWKITGDYKDLVGEQWHIGSNYPALPFLVRQIISENKKTQSS